jgi:TolB-like protein
MTAARRLAAILAADVVGYSRLMGEDEAGTAKIVRERREAATPIVRSFGGRVVKTTGDGVLLEFPSVVAAVECAIAIQKMMLERNAELPEAKRILYRVGVNLGDILIEGDDILGDGVNVAARLEGIADPGGVCISGTAYEHVRGRVEAEFADLGEKTLKNIARPVRVYALKLGNAAPTSSAAAEKSSPPHLSIVVLPFVNLAGDPQQDYFVDGVTESLTTDLSQMSGMRVVGRNTAFSYKNKAVELKQIGRDLNVRYILEGSVQRSGSRMRVNVQLIDAQSGNHLWADRFDKPVADLFDMQDEIVARLANALNTQLIIAEARRVEHAPTPDSMDLYFRGMSAYNRGLTPDNLSEARTLFERALALDPGNVDAIVGAAIASIVLVGMHMSDDRAARLAAAEALAVKPLSIAPEKASGHLCLGVVYIYTNRAVRGISELERALAIDRNLAAAHAYIGVAQNFVGRGEETAGHIEDALRLSPRDTAVYLWRNFNGSVKVFLAKNEEAVGELGRAIEANRNFSAAHFYLAVALVELGRLDEARLEVREGLSIDPTFTIRRYRADAPSDNPIFMSRRRQIYEIMRNIGVPEG